MVGKFTLFSQMCILQEKNGQFWQKLLLWGSSPINYHSKVHILFITYAPGSQSTCRLNNLTEAPIHPIICLFYRENFKIYFSSENWKIEFIPQFSEKYNQQSVVMMPTLWRSHYYRSHSAAFRQKLIQRFRDFI